MKKNFINENDELIIYNTKKVKDMSKKEKEMYERILKIQSRNTKLFCVSIFLFFLAAACFLGLAEYFVSARLETLWLALTLIILTSAIGLAVYSNITNSKEGKIKYCYKNEKYFYLAGLFTGLGVFAIFGGFTILGTSKMVFIALILLGLGAAFDIYHDKTGDKENDLTLVKEFVIALIVCVIFGFLGYFIRINSSNFTNLSNAVYEVENR